MISIRSSADLARAFEGALDPPLRRLLTLRRDQLIGDTDLDLSDIAHMIVVQRGDTLAAVEAEAGIPLATNLVDGSRYGEPGFTTSFEFVERHPGGWLEAVLILSDDGYGVALFVPDRIDTDPKLLLLLLAHA